MKFFQRYQKKSDEQLMILVQRGDHRAFSLIYDRYAGRMKAFFFRMLWSDNQMAEDFVHDLFAKIVENPKAYNSDYQLAPWLFQVASNMCKNAYRKKQFENEYLNQLEKAGIQLSTVDQQLDEKILTDQVYLILDKMDEEKRELFILKYQQQLSVKQLADIYGTNEGTIKSRLFHIRKTLIGSLSEQKL